MRRSLYSLPYEVSQEGELLYSNDEERLSGEDCGFGFTRGKEDEVGEEKMIGDTGEDVGERANPAEEEGEMSYPLSRAL